MREVDIKTLALDPIRLIGGDWMLLTAGTQQRGWNTMTCSWGHLGTIWGSNHGMSTSVCYVRPQRYTKQFIDREEIYTLSFFDGRKKELAYLGSHSGRDGDKVAAVGLTPVFDGECTYFAEAKLVLVCRKLYQAPLTEAGFVHPETVEENYPERDFHDMYIGQIVRALVADGE